MIKTAICDDEKNIRDYLISLIQKQAYPCEIMEYASAEAYLAGKEETDLLFLDIELGAAASGINGMALAQQIRAQAQARQPVIIFVTGFEKYVWDAFDVNAFQYLLKPIEEKKFSEVFSRAVEMLLAEKKKSAQTLTFPCANVKKTISFNDIYYVESSNHKVILHARGGDFSYYARLRDIEMELGEMFFRIHKGYLVNLFYVKAYSKTEVFLENGDKLLISKYKYPEFVKAYLLFLKQGISNE